MTNTRTELLRYFNQQMSLGLAFLGLAFAVSTYLTGTVVSSTPAYVSSTVAPQIIQTLLTVDGVLVGFVVAFLPSRVRTRQDNLWKLIPDTLFTSVIATIAFGALIHALDMFGGVSVPGAFDLHFFRLVIWDTITLAVLVLFYTVVGVVSRLLVSSKRFMEFPNPASEAAS